MTTRAREVPDIRSVPKAPRACHVCGQRHEADQIRNVGLFAHIDAGKTTLTEAIGRAVGERA